jgi:uncharacterized membrane protein
MSKENKDIKDKASETFKKIMDTEDSSRKFDKKDIESGKGMAILSYFGILALIPYFSEKKNEYVRYHARQGMDLFVVWIAYLVLYNILTSIIRVNGSCGAWFGYSIGNFCSVTPWWISWPLNIIGLCITVIALIGLINAINGKAKALPLLNKFKIFK